MDSRFFLWAAVALLWLLVYQTWQIENAPQPTSPQTAVESEIPGSSMPQPP